MKATLLIATLALLLLGCGAEGPVLWVPATGASIEQDLYLPPLVSTSPEDAKRQLRERGIAYDLTSQSDFWDAHSGLLRELRFTTQALAIDEHTYHLDYEFFGGRLYSIWVWADDPSAVLRALARRTKGQFAPRLIRFELRETLHGGRSYARAEDAGVFAELETWAFDRS